ncbi:MAG: histidinol-phosphatase HisJ [Proteobacteria bacterium]|nr:histidinol-phosphatase HisJ [Pseudomonadota bacterium]MBU1583073.1 histidinol-phosphatase HisJ [Pseudomonadota bacterium]MBU2455390.1 histidinol-phosphatase HisJ [Pseudomonadota bacterium]MBU2631447.1 histidinol-phosphatase HisJ [Pseudomonadota bacterium]
MDTTTLISLHGGHSGQYCSHAKDLLEDIIQQYIELGFKTVGITEHAPPINDHFLYPDEKNLHLTAADLYKRFEDYIKNLGTLKKKYASKIRIFVGMETETYTGYVDHITKLISRFQPDYIVGSVHHVDDICFDYSKKDYDKAVLMCGSIDRMYEKYFDQQHEMIKALKPFVVGHFDLIRIYDDHYKKRLLLPGIHEKIMRNLTLIKSLNLVMDFNLRPLSRGETEPYITSSILKTAKKLGIPAVPGDDSHGVKQAGNHVDKAIQILKANGFGTKWPEPRLLT